jgi:hypothetical protein
MTTVSTSEQLGSTAEGPATVTSDERPVPVRTAQHHHQSGAWAIPPDTARDPAPRARYPRRLVLALLLAAGGFAGWIIALAVRLPSRYRADHWNVAWAGFDVMLLISLVATGWVFVRRSPLAATASVVTSALLVCDAWFDVTTATGTADTALSVACAVAFELPLAAALVWAARRQLRAHSWAP